MNGQMPGIRDRSPLWLDRLADLWPNRTAIVDPDYDTRYSYDDLRRRALDVAARLAASGIGRGHRVAVLMPSTVEMLDLLFACGRLGAILVPLNWRLNPRELAAMIQDTDPALLLLHGEYTELAAIAGSSTPVMVFEEFMKAEPVRILPPAETRMDDPWLILFTGGTTGTPKGAVLTHGSIIWNAINTVVSWGLSERDIAPSFTPMFHTGGFNVFTLPLLMLGGTVILPARFDPAQALEILQREKPTLLFMVPTMFGLVAEQQGFDDADLSSLRWAISGGAPLPEAIYRRWEPKVRVFKQGYGLTEVGPNNFATSDEDALRRTRMTVGKLTVFAQARIVDEEGHDVPEGTPGELLLAGPHMCAGYWNRPEATAEAIRDGWFHTGDIAMRDEDGFYSIVDRKKDMIITGGENVYPSEIEAVLYSHPAIREVAVVGVPDATWGETVCAVVSLRAGRDVTPEELREYVRAHVARYKSPKRVIIVDDLPKNAAGKIVRAEAVKLTAVALHDPA